MKGIIAIIATALIMAGTIVFVAVSILACPLSEELGIRDILQNELTIENEQEYQFMDPLELIEDKDLHVYPYKELD